METFVKNHSLSQLPVFGSIVLRFPIQTLNEGQLLLKQNINRRDNQK